MYISGRVSIDVGVALGAAVFQLGCAVSAQHGAAVAAILNLVHGLDLAAVEASELTHCLYLHHFFLCVFSSFKAFSAVRPLTADS